jgi:hypothetical protein
MFWLGFAIGALCGAAVVYLGLSYWAISEIVDRADHF